MDFDREKARERIANYSNTAFGQEISIADLADEKTFGEAGLDSISSMYLALEFESQYNLKEIPSDKIRGNIGGFLDYIEKELSNESANHLA